MKTAFWWKGRKNFGDLLTPLLISRFSGVDVNWAPARDADILCVGSIIEAVLPDWTGIVAGCGKLYEATDVTDRLQSATVLGLRGPLTADGFSRKGLVLGDPGLLAGELVNVDKEYNLGIVPHWSDTALEHQFTKYEPHIIRPNQDALTVISEIGRCKKIVSSSLHGIIVADSFSIPRRIEYSTTLDKEGGLFKFRDYSASLGMELVLGKTQMAPRYWIEDMQHELYDMFELLGRMVHNDR